MSLDWEGARARLRAAQERLAAIDAEVGDFEALLHARSAALAAAYAAPQPTGIVDLVVFTVGGIRYAVAAVEVAEVVEVAQLTVLPGIPAFYRGLLSHRGVVFPLLDIRPLVRAGPSAPTVFAYALLFAADAQAVAVGADAVEGVVQASDGTAPEGAVLLDVRRLLGDARLIVDD